MLDKRMEPFSFYSVDGDKIGSRVELYMIKNNIEDLSNFSNQVVEALENIRDLITKNRGDVVLCAGDSILFRGHFDISWCEEVLQHFLALTGCTASMGIGSTTTESYLALKVAKDTGGGKVVHYTAIWEG